MVRFSDARPVGWRLAETTLTGVGAGMNTCYPVDSGMGCFADSAAAELMGRSIRSFEAKNPGGNYYESAIAVAVPSGQKWCDFRPEPKSELNLILFSSGLGDDPMYSSYWGIDGSGATVCLVTDFKLFDHKGTIFRK